MKIGLPKALYYYKYFIFIEEFLKKLNITFISSPDTNKYILNDGIKYCIDEACLPIKIFHGHVSYLKNKCDLIVVPRIMKVNNNEYICPKFCGLPEMILNSIPDLPSITTLPIYINDNRKLLKWCINIGKYLGKSTEKSENAFIYAVNKYKNTSYGLNDTNYPLKIALIGHSYTVYDKYINMNIIKKLHSLNIGIITEEQIDNHYKEEALAYLYRKPFWSNVRESFGTAIHLVKKKEIDGIIHLSSFQCGIDSIVIDLIKDIIDTFPMLVLKLDEHSGEAGFDTRLEAFIDMLKRRN